LTSSLTTHFKEAATHSQTFLSGVGGNTVLAFQVEAEAGQARVEVEAAPTSEDLAKLGLMEFISLE